MAILTITYEDGSFANWPLTEREADVSHFAIEKLFGKPGLNSGRSKVAKEKDRRRTSISPD